MRENENVAQLCWNEGQWARAQSVLKEEAARARVAARLLPVFGPIDPTDVAVAQLTLGSQLNPLAGAGGAGVPVLGPPRRLLVDSDPTLRLTTIAVQVQLESHEVVDGEMTAALQKLRRAATIVARVEDALVFSGRAANAAMPRALVGANPAWSQTATLSDLANPREGVEPYTPPPNGRVTIPLGPPAPPGIMGVRLINAIRSAVTQLENNGHSGPFACVLSDALFGAAHTPTAANLVLPRDRFVPFLEGGRLLRSSSVLPGRGLVVALGGDPVELVVAKDISATFLQVTPEPRWLLRVSERIALRLKQRDAIAHLSEPGE